MEIEVSALFCNPATKHFSSITVSKEIKISDERQASYLARNAVRQEYRKNPPPGLELVNTYTKGCTNPYVEQIVNDLLSGALEAREKTAMERFGAKSSEYIFAHGRGEAATQHLRECSYCHDKREHLRVVRLRTLNLGTKLVATPATNLTPAVSPA